jgi:formylglycine-generating enzyme required for sulfatase activity
MKAVSIIAMISLCVFALCSFAPSQTPPSKGGAVRAPASEPATQAAKELTLDLGNNVTMKLALIPAGKFTMGSPGNEKDRYSDEGPHREVTISKPFYMGATEVTQAQYEAVMGKNPAT